MLALIVVAALPAGAQTRGNPPSDTPPVVDPFAIQDAVRGVSPAKREQNEFDALRKQRKSQEKADPQAALAAYRQFLADRPGLSAQVGVQVHKRIAGLYLNPLKDYEEAHKVCDAAMKKYAGNADAYLLLEEKTSALLATGRGPEALTLYQARLDKILAMHPWNASLLLRQYHQLLEQSLKPAEVAALFGRAFVMIPEYVSSGDPNWDWMHASLDKALTKLQRRDELLGWSRARFMACDYNVNSIDRAARHLTRVWSGPDPSRAGLEAFAAAQKDATRLNPLSEVKLPATDPEMVKVLLRRYKDKPRERIGVLLLSGQVRAAMEGAQKLMSERPKDAAGAREVARVFKAADLNLIRANAFLEFRKSGTGADPLDAFFEQHPPASGQARGQGAAPSPVSPAFVTLADTMGWVHAKRLTLEAAHEQGLLPREALLYLLQVSRPWEAGDLLSDQGEAVAGVLVRHHPEAVSDPAQLSTIPRLWVGSYLCQARDERGPLFVEEALKEKRTIAQLGWYQEHITYQLGDYYRATGQLNKALDVFLRAHAETKLRMYRADFAVEAARIYRQLGDHQKAQELYAQVPRYDDGWNRGMALWDQAQDLIFAGKHEQARSVLKQPVNGTGRDADLIRLALKMLLGYSYYRAGELEAAQKCLDEAMVQHKALGNGPGRNIDGNIRIARSCLDWIQRWKKEPVVWEAKEFHVAMAEPKRAVIWRFNVRSLRPVSLTVTAQHAGVKAWFTDEGGKSSQRYYHEQQLVVEAAPDVVKNGLEEVLTVSSKEFPGFQARVPVHVAVQSLRRLSTKTLFGVPKTGEALLRTLKLSAPAAFRILEVKCDDADLKAHLSRAEKAATQHEIELTLGQGSRSRPRTGLLQVVTDLPAQPVVEVSYSVPGE